MIHSLSGLIYFLYFASFPQAVVQYMVELVEKRDVKTQVMKQKKSWAQICFFSRSNKRKRNGMDYVKA